MPNIIFLSSINLIRNCKIKLCVLCLVISTLEHEVDYWNVLTNSTKVSERAGATAFRDILKPLARDFR